MTSSEIYKVMIDENLFILVVQLHVAFVALPESVRVERDFSAIIWQDRWEIQGLDSGI